MTTAYVTYYKELRRTETVLAAFNTGLAAVMALFLFVAGYVIAINGGALAGAVPATGGLVFVWMTAYGVKHTFHIWNGYGDLVESEQNHNRKKQQ